MTFYKLLSSIKEKAIITVRYYNGEYYTSLSINCNGHTMKIDRLPKEIIDMEVIEIYYRQGCYVISTESLFLNDCKEIFVTLKTPTHNI